MDYDESKQFSYPGTYTAPIIVDEPTDTLEMIFSGQMKHEMPINLPRDAAMQYWGTYYAAFKYDRPINVNFEDFHSWILRHDGESHDDFSLRFRVTVHLYRDHSMQPNAALILGNMIIGKKRHGVVYENVDSFLTTLVVRMM